MIMTENDTEMVNKIVSNQLDLTNPLIRKRRNPPSSYFSLTKDKKLSQQNSLSNSEETKVSSKRDVPVKNTIVSLPKKITEEILKNPIWRSASEINILSRKTSNINVGKKFKPREYLEKSKVVALIKYSSQIKEARLKRLQEVSKSEIAAVDSTISSLEIVKKKFNNDIFDKYSEYLRHLIFQIYKEREQLDALKQKKISIKFDIENLKKLIEKTKGERDNISRWAFLQIQIKEKLLVLPDYYYSVLRYDVDSDDKKGTEEVSDKEKERLLNCKSHLIFPTFDDINAELKELENENLKLMKKENNATLMYEKIFKEKEKRRKVKEEEDDKIAEEIAEKKEALKNLKEVYMKLVHQRMKAQNEAVRAKQMIKSIKLPNLEINKRTLLRSLSCESIKPVRRQNGDLYNKILELFSSALQFPKRELPSEEEEHKVKKVKLSQGAKMLEMLEFVEIVTTALLKIFKEYRSKKQLTETMKIITKKVEKESRRKKIEKQKEIEIIKKIELKKKLEEKIKKVYYIPKRKVDMKYSHLLKRNRRYQKSVEEENPTFNDFMYDIFDN